MQKQIVKTFESTLFGSLHTVVDSNGAPWFAGRQVATKLGFKTDATISRALTRHCHDKVSLETFTPSVKVLPKGLRSNSVFISEADLYRMVLRSDLEEAQAFQDWVVREVLPSIRNHGGYHAEQPEMAKQYADPELFAQVNESLANFGLAMANLTTMIVQQNQKIDKLAEQVVSMKSDGAPTEDDVPYGYEVRSRVWAHLRARMGGACLNSSAFSRMLNSASWPEVRFMRFNREGLLVPTTYLKPTHRYKGEEVTPEGLMNRVILESNQVTDHKFTHPLIGDYLQ